MQEIPLGQALESTFDALWNDRLAVLCGAGLSMAPPSCLPSAAILAAKAKEKYDTTYGVEREPLPVGIEDQAEFFFQRGELATVYLRKLVDRDAFAGAPIRAITPWLICYWYTASRRQPPPMSIL